MALKSTITSSVNNAFNLIGDLGETINFTNASIEGYDFSNNSVEGNATTLVSIKGIVSKQYKDISDNPRLLSDITIKTTDLSAIELDNYDLVNFRSKNWNINNVSDNGFITVITVAREI